MVNVLNLSRKGEQKPVEGPRWWRSWSGTGYPTGTGDYGAGGMDKAVEWGESHVRVGFVPAPNGCRFAIPTDMRETTVFPGA